MSTFHFVADGWVPLAWAVTWQFAALALLAWACEKALRLRQARVRQALWWFVLIAPLALAPARLSLTQREAGVMVVVAAPAPVAVAFRAADEVLTRPSPALAGPGGISGATSGYVAFEPWWAQARAADVLLVAWLAGCLVAALRLLVGHRRVRRMLGESVPVEDAGAQELLRELCVEAGVRAHVELRGSAAVGAPLLYGLRRPVIVVPQDWVGDLGREGLRALLAHEVAHIMRRDFAANLAQRIVCVPLFFHPCAWMASRRITLAREELCDAWALGRGADAFAYARSLTAAAERAYAGIAAASVGVAESRFTLLRRVEAIMETANVRRLDRPVAIGLAALLVVSAAVIATVQLGGSYAGRVSGEAEGAAVIVVEAQGDSYRLTIRQLTISPDPRAQSIAGGIDYAGKRLAIESNADLAGENATGMSELFAMSADGSDLRQLTHGARGLTASWISGDGTKVVFNAPGDLTGKNPDGSREVFVASFDGKDLRQLSFSPDPNCQVYTTKISHDGQWISFISYADLTGDNSDHSKELFVVRSDGTELHQLTNEPDIHYGLQQPSAFICPDGERLAFASSSDPLGLNADHSSEVFVINRDGSGLRQLTDSPDASEGFQVSFGMAQDGRILLGGWSSATGQGPSPCRQVFVVNADGTGLKQLTADPKYDSWLGTMSNDGKVISFRSQADFTGQNPDHSWEVFLMDGEGKHLTQVSQFAGSPSNPRTVFDRVSGDGRWLAFSCTGNPTGGNPDGSLEAFLAKIAPPSPHAGSEPRPVAAGAVGGER